MRELAAAACTKRLARGGSALHQATSRVGGAASAMRAVAAEPERDRDLAVRFRAGSGARLLMRDDIEARGRHPLRHRLGRKAEPAMGVLVAQEFEIVRREIDHQQPAAGPQHARRLLDRARAVVEEVQHLVDDDGVEGILRQREVVDVALPHAAMLEPGAVEPRARERQHVERQIEAEAALDAAARTVRACARCRCRDRAASGIGARQARARSPASTASSATCSLRMRSHSAACRRK